MESEFGKGLVICLVKFAEHLERFPSDKKMYEEMRLKRPDLFNESDAVEMYFNGASDHLYEIEVPQKWGHTKIGEKVKQLQNKGIEIGHGFTDKKWKASDVYELHELCREISLLIDEELGLKPEMGKW